LEGEKTPRVTERTVDEVNDLETKLEIFLDLTISLKFLRGVVLVFWSYVQGRSKISEVWQKILHYFFSTEPFLTRKQEGYQTGILVKRSFENVSQRQQT